MCRIVFLAALATLATAQYGSPKDYKNAAILSESRYLSGDGSFGAAYSQEDGVNFKEETDADGNRKGSYSYVDPTGKKLTVTYTAGKDGFRVSGDHLPKAPIPAPVAAPQPQYQPQPQYNPPQPQYNPPQQQYYNPNPQPAAPAYNQNGQYSYSLGNQQQQQQQYNPHQYNHFDRNANAVPYHHTTTPTPRNFHPPGSLNLNRTPDGYSYTFNKN